MAFSFVICVQYRHWELIDIFLHGMGLVLNDFGSHQGYQIGIAASFIFKNAASSVCKYPHLT